MVAYCCVPGCNKRSCKNRSLSFHCFPKGLRLQQVWINAIGLKNWKPTESSKVCSLHFKEEDFNRDKKNIRIKKTAIPSRNVKSKTAKKTVKIENEQEVYIENNIMDTMKCEDDRTVEEKIIIGDILKSIVCSLELLVKFDPDSERSAIAKDKITIALFGYHKYLNDEEINLTLFKDFDVLEDSDPDDTYVIYNDDANKLEALDEDVNEEIVECSLYKIETLKHLMDNNCNASTKSEDNERPLLKNEDVLIKYELDGHVETVFENMDEKNISNTSSVPRFVCDICNFTLVSEHLLAVHKPICNRKHYYYGNPKLEEYWNRVLCPLCDVKCDHIGNLRRHYITHRIRDIEAAFQPIKEEQCIPGNPQRNMQLFNDFMIEFEKKEELLKASQSKAKELDTSDETKPIMENKIGHYIQFNLKKIAYSANVNKELRCISCDITFSTKEKLAEHKKKWNGVDTFVCNHCNETFHSPVKLTHHMKKHKGLPQPSSVYLNSSIEDMEGCPRQIDFKMYVCKYCLLIFVQDSSLNNHLISYKKNLCCIPLRKCKLRSNAPKKTRSKDGRYHCDVCEKSYANYYYLQEHKQNSHSIVFDRFECGGCGKAFTSKKRLVSHIRYTHTDTLHVMCDICGIKASLNNLKRHKKIHSNDKPHKCCFCDKKFRLPDSLKCHLRTHTLEKPWSCQYCGIAFSEKRRYNIHVNIHEGKTPYKCNECPNAFVSKYKLNKHMLIHFNCKL